MNKLSISRPTFKWLISFGLLVALMAVGTLTPVSAAGFIVNSSLDTVDVEPGDGVCKDENGLCTLRAAIDETNHPSNSGLDTITLPAGIYILTLEGRAENGNQTGDLDILDDLIINGSGAKNTFIQAGQSKSEAIDRVIDSHSSIRLTLNQLTVRYGDAADDESKSGGGIWVRGGTLIVNDAAVNSNTAAAEGGAIFTEDGEVNLNRSLLAFNQAPTGSALATSTKNNF